MIKFGDGGKAVSRGIGNAVGWTLGKLYHGITHSSTAAKNEKLAKTIEDENGLVYAYNKTLKLAYVRDGANIISSHCLTNDAKQSFNDIATLADALISSNISNARSIKAMSDALDIFESKVSSAKFAPCKSVLDWKFARVINNGGIKDSSNGKCCMIKGIRVYNYDAAKEYSREFTHKDIRELQKRGMKDRKYLVIPREKWDKMTPDAKAEAFKTATEKYDGGPFDENGKPYKKENTNENVSTCTERLSTLFEQANLIDWKEVFNG